MLSSDAKGPGKVQNEYIREYIHLVLRLCRVTWV